MEMMQEDHGCGFLSGALEMAEVATWATGEKRVCAPEANRNQAT